MKVLKDNYNKHSSSNNTKLFKQYPKECVCENCESTLQYDESDITIGVYGVAHIRCPLCKHIGMLDDDENDITLTKDNIEFPNHFHHTSIENGAVDVCNNEQVRRAIARVIEYLRENKDDTHYYTEFGNLRVSVDRYENSEEYYVVVTNNYYSTFIPFESEDY